MPHLPYTSQEAGLTQYTARNCSTLSAWELSAGSGIPSTELAASRMTGCLVVALEVGSLSTLLMFAAPMMPDRLPEVLALTCLVGLSFFLHYR